jgi:MYXO-CTERM domain-containing protein
VQQVRRVKGGRTRRGLSGLGLLMVIVGLVALAVTYSVLPATVWRLWPLVLVAVGVFGLVRRPGWVAELDWHLGADFGRAADRPRRIFSLSLIVAGLIALLFSLRLVDERIVGPVVLIGLGLLLMWRRSRSN